MFSLKERCSLLLLNTFPFTEVVHEDHPNLVTENLRATTYEYYLHVYLNSRPPYCKYIVKIIYEIELNQEKLELKGCEKYGLLNNFLTVYFVEYLILQGQDCTFKLVI